jgi:site-specific DNA recombinase
MSKTPAKRAVLYLRVSSRGQVETDYDDDGLSIAGQRARCAEEAAKYDAIVVDEYIERAETAKTDDRPELQRMLARIREQRDVDYVILWKVDRFARNRRDDANMLFDIETAGARLISATENIDETPAGRLMHGMLASFAEYYSQNLAREVIKGATEKAKRGGTPGIAPLGYLNVRETVDGRDVRTVAPDPKRAPLITLAFSLYATGRFSINELVALLEAKGLRTRGNRRYSPRPINHSTLHTILSNPYYAGWVTYRGTRYRGRHEALVSQELFDQVQAVLRAHKLSGERKRNHASHYLKGTLRCGADDCEMRLTFSRNSGNGGTYEYFVCPNKQRGKCDQPYHRVEVVEAAVERYYRTVQLSKAHQECIRAAIKARLDEMAAISKRELERCNGELLALDEQERTLLQKHYQGRVSDKLYDEEQSRIARQREAAEAISERLLLQFDDIKETLDLALALTDDIQAAYIQASPTVRRLFNQALFEWLKIDSEEVSEAKLAEPFSDLLADDLLIVLEAPEDDQAPDPVGRGLLVSGSISDCRVGRAGLEPATDGL